MMRREALPRRRTCRTANAGGRRSWRRDRAPRNSAIASPRQRLLPCAGSHRPVGSWLRARCARMASVPCRTKSPSLQDRQPARWIHRQKGRRQMLLAGKHIDGNRLPFETEQGQSKPRPCSSSRRVRSCRGRAASPSVASAVTQSRRECGVARLLHQVTQPQRPVEEMALAASLVTLSRSADRQMQRGPVRPRWPERRSTAGPVPRTLRTASRSPD